MWYLLSFLINDEICKEFEKKFIVKTKSLNDVKKVKKMCTKLREMSGKTPTDILFESTHGNSIPVDIERIIRSYGIHINRTDFAPIESMERYKDCGHILGAVFTDGNELNISYSANNHLETLPKSLSIEEVQKKVRHRKRFTLAHELAHCCLHMNPEKDKYFLEFRTDQLNYEDEKERQANIFAGELLIPKEPLMYVYEKLKVPSVDFLAEIFDVSRAVMAARLDVLNLYYCSNLKVEGHT